MISFLLHNIVVNVEFEDMKMSLRALQDLGQRGQLKVNVTEQRTNVPVSDASVTISYTGGPQTPIENLVTNSVGQTEIVSLATPPIDYSLAPSDEQPYAEYTLEINASGFESIVITGVNVMEGVTALQNVELVEAQDTTGGRRIVISPHTLFGDYPPKIAEAEIKPTTEQGEIVLSEVVVPEFVIVHDGPPTDTSAQNYYVRYRDYIKNVASSEIYPTWPDNTIRANILAIMSFTLNRVYTEWYRNKGFNFTITSSTAYDHKWMPGRNYFDTVSRITDEVFGNYLSRPNVRQPILTQYCDGVNVTCPNWLSQWGSKDLGDAGYSTIDIIRHYYGNSMYINIAEEVSGVPASWPGYNLTIGSTGAPVRQIQEQLNRIAVAYPLVPTIAVDGIFGESTAEAVRVFQSIFDLSPTGIVDYPTWYRISDIYVAVSRIAELQ